MFTQRLGTAKTAAKKGLLGLGLGFMALAGTVSAANATIYHSHVQTVPPGHRIQLEFSVGGAAAIAREGEVKFKSNLMSSTAVAPAWYVGDNIMRATLPAPTDASSVTYTLVARNPTGEVESSQSYTINVSGPDLAPSKTARRLKLKASSKYASMGYLPGFEGRTKLSQGYTTFANTAPAPKPAAPMIKPRNDLPTLASANTSTRPASSAGPEMMQDDGISYNGRPSTRFFIELAGSFVEHEERDFDPAPGAFEYDSNPEGTLALGIEFGGGFAVALEGSYGKTKVDCVGGCGAMDATFVAPALTFAYFIPTGTPFRPYVGLGGGWNFIEYDVTGGNIDEDGPMALADVGLAIGLGKYFDILMGYRYAYSFMDTGGLEDFGGHRGRLGVRFGF